MANNEGEQSPREKVEDYVNSAQDKYNKARTVYKGGKLAARGTKARARVGAKTLRTGGQLAARIVTAAAETIEIWGIPALIIGVILIIMVVSGAIIVLLSPPPTAGVEPTPTPPINQACELVGGQCSSDATCLSVVPPSIPNADAICSDPTKPTCCVPKNVACDTNPTAALKQNFNVVVYGDSNLEHLKRICNILSIPGKSPTYTSLLKRGGPTEIDFDNLPCGGRTHQDGSITLHDFWNCGSDQAFVLIHETGHTIALYNGNVSQRFLANAYYPSDSACYYVNPACTGFQYTHYLRTYGPGCGGGGRAESFAESVALYVMPKGVLSNYQTQCPVGYNWERINIFGGYEF